MSAEENKALSRKVMEEVWHKRRLEAIDELFALDYVGHDLSNPGWTEGIDAAKQASASFLSAFSDFHVTCDHILGEGDKVALQYNVLATHMGEFAGIAPTGRRVAFSGLTIQRWRDGTMAEQWQIVDIQRLMQQLEMGPA